MKKIITFNISKGENFFVAECIDLPIITQGMTIDETIENIREALLLHLEGEDLTELMISKSPAISVHLDLGELEYA